MKRNIIRELRSQNLGIKSISQATYGKYESLERKIRKNK